MSYDIYTKAIYNGIEIEFEMPNLGRVVDLDFNGKAMIQAINNNGKMQLTGLAINGRGDIISLSSNSVKFTQG